MNNALLNIQKLAASGYSRNTMNPTRRASASIRMIATLNHQEVHDTEIANALCDIHHAIGIRLQTIERRAAELLAAERQAENCPRCGSAAYGQEADGRMTCMHCQLGVDPWQDRTYSAGYDYACGYYD